MLLRLFVGLILIGNLFFGEIRCAAKSPANDDSDEVCVDEMACADKLGFEAIMTLHKILDDDANGAVDVTESDEFLREELQYENGHERRHSAFHLNDKYISVKELWEIWKKSEVHNWTVEQTIEWLVASVELPQYIQTFQENAVDGTTIPRLAVNNMHFLNNILGIKDPIHKQKLALKAMDVVLFGAPKVGRNFFKDVMLVTSLVIAIGGCWFAYLQHKYSQQHIKKMLRDMESLQKAEDALTVLHVELDKARQDQETVTLEKKNLEQRLQDELSGSKRDSDNKEGLMTSEDMDRLKFAEEELRHVRDELRRAQHQLQDHQWLPPPSLQHWLQLTHELELRSYNCKKSNAEAQLAAAKEGCEKLRKKRSSLMGAFRVAHGSTIDDVDSRILQAKAALTEVTQDLKERLHRWRQVEALCGFSIVNNTGLMYLQSVLQGSTLNGTLSQGSLISGSQDDLDDIETASTYAPTISAAYNANSTWHSDHVAHQVSQHRSLQMFEGGSQPNLSTLAPSLSLPVHPGGNGSLSPTVKRCRSAGSEAMDKLVRGSELRNIAVEAVVEEDSGVSTTESNSIQSSHQESDRPIFSLGDSPTTEISHDQELLGVKYELKPPTARLVKSYSHEQSSPPKEVPPHQHSNSESALDLQGKKKKSTVVVRSAVPTTVLDEENSTDSGSMADDDLKKEKKEKKRFTLPTLRRSHKTKTS